MEHFYKNIPGWSNDIIGQYADAVQKAQDGAHFVEVGCWKGRSAAFMAVEIINSNKQITFDCIDHFRGSEEHLDPTQEGYDKDAVDGKLLQIFTDNMLPVAGHYNLVPQSSPEAVVNYADASLNFVFIDASHDYDSVKADILAWWPKIKPGGVLAGHDVRHPPIDQALKDTEQTIGKYVSNFWDCWQVTKPV